LREPGFVDEAGTDDRSRRLAERVRRRFRHRVVEGGGDWTAAVSDGSAWWFSLDLGIDVDGERVPLLTALLRQLRQPDRPP
jgi:hypothetical protein